MRRHAALLICLTILVITTIIAWRICRPEARSGATQPQVTVALPDVAAPSGWTADRVSPSEILFHETCESACTNKALSTIILSAEHSGESLEEWAAKQTVDTYPDFSPKQTWNLAHGHLLLGIVGHEDVTASLTYLFYSGGTIYSASLLPFDDVSPSAAPNAERVASVRAIIVDVAMEL
jgi:hypothetical protein